MTKAELIDAMATDANISKKEAKAALDSLMKNLKKALKKEMAR